MDSFGSDMMNNLISSVKEAATEDTTLDFSGKSINLNTAEDAKGLVSAIEGWPPQKLKSLELRGNTLGVAAAEAVGKSLEGRPELSNALWSDLFTGRMKTEIPQALSHLGKGMMTAQAQLTVLDLSDNAFGPIGVGGLADLLKSPVCAFLQVLKLNNNGLGITGAKLLVEALKPMPVHLQVLEMGRNRLENVGATAMSTIITNLSKLRVLRVPQNGIYLPGVTALCSALSHCPQLETLDLNDNTVGPRGAAVLGAILPKLPHLAELNLGDCLLKTRGAMKLLDAMQGHLSNLKDLNLSYDEIGGRAVSSLSRELLSRPSLRCKLGGNSLGAGARTALSAPAFHSRVELRSPEEEEEGSEEDDEEEEESHGEDEDNEDEVHDSGASSGEEAEVNKSALDRTSDSINLSNRSALDLSSVADGQVTPAAKFIANPSKSNLDELGQDPVAVLQDHLSNMPDDIAYLELAMQSTMGLCGLRELESAKRLLHHLSTWAQAAGGRRWLLANSVLSNLRLIKSEKKSSTKWDLENCAWAVSEMSSEAWFPADLLETLRFFIKLHVDDATKETLVDFTKYPRLYQK